MTNTESPSLSAFESATAVTRTGDDTFVAHVPPGWEQGRGAFGGVSLGVMLRAMLACEEDASRRLRTLSGELAGPVVAGPAEIRVTRLRRGKNQTNLRADLLQDGVIQGTASIVLSPPRPRAVVVPWPSSNPPAWSTVTAIDAAFSPVPFARHFEYRVTGPIPGSGGEPRAAGWVRLREPVTRFDGPALIAHLDAFWSAIISSETKPRAFATVTFLAEVLADPATLSTTEPFHHDARVLASEDGFVVEERALSQGGRLVALNHQTFAMLT